MLETTLQRVQLSLLNWNILALSLHSVGSVRAIMQYGKAAKHMRGSYRFCCRKVWRWSSKFMEIYEELIISILPSFPWSVLLRWNVNMNRYTVTKQLGDGTYGSVLKAVNRQTGEVVSCIMNSWIQETTYETNTSSKLVCPMILVLCSLIPSLHKLLWQSSWSYKSCPKLSNLNFWLSKSCSSQSDRVNWFW